MTLQIIPSGVPTRTMLQALSNQTHITATTSQRTGMSSVPAGLHCYDTSLQADFVWNGSTWILLGGRRIGFTQLSAGALSTGSNHTISFSSNVADTDSFRTSSSLFTIPSWAGGVYNIFFHTVAANAFGYGPSGGVAGISRNSGAEFWAIEVPTIIDGTPTTRQPVHATQALAGGDTLEFVIAHTVGSDETFNTEAICYRTGP